MFDTTISKQNELRRYQYVVVLICIIVLILILDKKTKLTSLEDINVKGLIAYFIVVAVVFSVCMMRQTTKQKLSDNTWDIGHFLFYFGLAYFIPNNYLLVSTLMVAWELFEDFMSYNVGKKAWLETNGKKMTDMMANTGGYYLGNLFFGRDIKHVDFKRRVDKLKDFVFRK
jgi:hypothetical protein